MPAQAPGHDAGGEPAEVSPGAAPPTRPGASGGDPPAPLTVIIPAFDEAASVGAVVAGLRALPLCLRVLVVDDGSRDQTAAVARAHGADVLSHRTRRGNGAAITSGLASLGSGPAADRGLVALLDADGQHDPAHLPALRGLVLEGAHLAVAARDAFTHSGWARDLGNHLLCMLAAFMTRRPIPDLTSGYRVFRLGDLRPWIELLPQGFSTPTTTTLAFLHSGRRVEFLTVPARARAGGGVTRTRLLRDGPWFCAVALKVTTLFDPRRAAAPLVLGAALGTAAGAGAALTLGASPAAAMLLLLTGLVGGLPLGLALALLRGLVIQTRARWRIMPARHASARPSTAPPPGTPRP